MDLHNLKSKYKNKSRRRVGRGNSSGMGKTSTRGAKGEKSRTGYNIPKRFEGGQTSIIQKLPKKRGVYNQKVKAKIINLSDLDKQFKENEIVNPKTLINRGLLENMQQKFKILANGKLSKKIIIKNCLYSKKVKKLLTI